MWQAQGAAGAVVPHAAPRCGHGRLPCTGRPLPAAACLRKLRRPSPAQVLPPHHLTADTTQYKSCTSFTIAARTCCVDALVALDQCHCLFLIGPLAVMSESF